MEKKFENTKGVIKSRKSEDRQYMYNGQKKEGCFPQGVTPQPLHLFISLPLMR
jgi:hypothetical protein